ncbi:MAG: hypothetical protein IPK19_17445 [Chloroflexi bacterium]|nr:hypothetical protein [Chloroflexota bacterium]
MPDTGRLPHAGAGCLQPGARREILLTAGDNTVNAGTRRVATPTQDNVVNISDFSMLAAAFRVLTSDGPGFDARADFNADGVISISDFSLLASSFAQMGESL